MVVREERGPWVPGLLILWVGVFAVAIPFMAWRVLETKNPVDQGYEVYPSPPPERLVDSPAPLAEPLTEGDRMFVGGSARKLQQLQPQAPPQRLQDAQKAFEESVQKASVDVSSPTQRPVK